MNSLPAELVALAVANTNLNDALNAVKLFVKDKNDRFKKSDDKLFRLKIIQDASIIYYAKIFKKSHGLKMIGDLILNKFDDEEKKLHKEIIKYRDKILVHSDFEKIRIKMSIIDVGEKDKNIPIATIYYDKGLIFYDKSENLLNLIQKSYHISCEHIFEELKKYSGKGMLSVDYLDTPYCFD